MNPSVFDRLELVVGDITKQVVDAVVAAANEGLRGGGGVDGAIHRAAGPALLEECRTIGRCPPGEARLTQGYLLPARYVIHTVGPVWEGGGYGEPEILASCYRSTLKRAADHGIQSVAVPCIATGVYGYPQGPACEIAVRETVAWLRRHDLPRRVVFCCFDGADADLYRARLAETAAAG